MHVRLRGVPGERRVRRRGSKLPVASNGAPRVQLEEIQRSRLLVAAAAIDELGYELSTRGT